MRKCFNFPFVASGRALSPHWDFLFLTDEITTKFPSSKSNKQRIQFAAHSCPWKGNCPVLCPAALGVGGLSAETLPAQEGPIAAPITAPSLSPYDHPIVQRKLLSLSVNNYRGNFKCKGPRTRLHFTLKCSWLKTDL